jgi:ArsR family transcriptional regulator
MIEILKALAEENRLRIMSLLIENEMCVCKIESCLNMTQSNASRHLTILKQSGILQSFKQAQWTYYRINDTFKQEQKELYEFLLTKLKELPTYQKDHEEYVKYKDIDTCENNEKPH